ncbi:MAG: lamin tail domain-containing protein [Bacteroidetes bacterium]|nr:lamin tail domain-containing protein [Bacteroidota bacterium]
MKKIAFFCFLTFCLSRISKAQIVLNEMQSSNWGIISASGELEDWIEIKNKTGNAVTLSKFYLSTDRRNLKMWRFPANTTIAANSLAIVFASGKNGIIASKMHTNFKLSYNNSTVYLSDSNGNLIDEHLASGITSKTSWARVPDGSNNWCILGTPTPGATNGNGSCITQFAPPPIVSVKPGIYTSRVTLTVTCPDSGTFKYTLDGSTVGQTAKTSGSKSSGTSIQLDTGSCVLKIRTFKTGKHPSTEWVGTYIIHNSKIPPITLPIVSISLNPDSFNTIYQNVDKDNEKGGYVQILDKKGNLMTQFGANFTIHGNYSSSFPQKSLRVETRQWLDSSSIDYQLYPKKIYKFQNFNLRNAGVDWMRRHVSDLLTSTLVRELNADCGDGRQVLGYINGKYYGVYEIREKYDNDYAAENHNVNADSIDMLSYSGVVNYGKDSAWTALSSLANSLNLSVDSNFNKVAKYIDLDNWIDYFTTEMYIANTDWPGNNIKWWRPQRQDGKWRYILWDLDFGWGIPWGGGGGIAVSTDLSGSVFGGGLIIGDLMNNVAFRKKFINRYADLINTTFRYENVAGTKNVYSMMKALTDTLDKEMPRAYSRWKDPASAVNGAANTYADWKGANFVGAMFIWARDRPKYGRINIKNYYSTTISDTVNITLQVSPAGAGRIKINTIYPTIGSSWKGTYYKGVPVTVTAIANPGYEFSNWNINGNDTNVTTTKDFTTASTVVATFSQVSTIETPKIAVTEINYNSNTTLNSGNWFELKNYGQSTVELTGWVMETRTIWKKYKFPDGFKIKSGEYMVFCSDTTSFYKLNSRSIKTVVLPFDLDNKQEQLELKDPSNKTYLNINWNNNSPWPMTADGHGRTMELVNDTANNSIATNWFNGCIGGSPGKAFTPCNEPFRVSEINYNSPTYADAGDWIEIYNYKTDTLKLGGWKMNDKDFWNTWKFPDSIKIAPGERRVVCGDTTKFKFVNKNVTPIYFKGLNLKNSEDVLEFYAPNDTIGFSVAYADSFPFPFKADGKGYTLDLKDSVRDMSSGSSWRAVCISGSPGTTSSACEGGIIVSEVNFKSASFNDAGDWFELHNTNSSSFNLSGWKLTDDTTNNIYTIPNNVILPGFGYLVFVADTVKFKEMYPWVKNYIGNFAFSLGSKSDAVKLYNTKGSLVNGLKYDDVAPWPSGVSGRGYTIELTDSDAWLSDGNKWRRSGCLGGSPGGPNTNCNDSFWVTEINYNSDKFTDAGDWVEFVNAGGKDIDISNWRFMDANKNDTFFIPNSTIVKSKERIVLANSLKKLTEIHDTVKNAIGNFNFGLASSNEQLILRDPNGRLRFGMDYNTDSTWSTLPDGNGYTLTLIKNKTDFISPLSWTTACPAGSPGKDDGSCNAQIAFSEINYSSETSLNSGDWIELVNTGRKPVDLTNYKFVGNNFYDFFYALILVNGLKFGIDRQIH